MKGLFEFLKQKIIEVKQQNKQQIQALTSVISQNQYSTEKVLVLLQSMKASYMNWNILIANEASTGLYFSQVHNRNICLRKIKLNKQMKKNLQKNKMKLNHIKDTANQIKEISQLTDKWATSVNFEIEQMNQNLNKMKSIVNKQKQKQKQMIQKQINSKAQNQKLQTQGGMKSALESLEHGNKQQKMEQIVDDIDIQV